MKKILLVALLGACAGATLPLAGAQTTQQGDTVTIPAPAPLQIAAPGPGRYMDPAEFGRYKGGYSLSNGQTLTLSRSGTRMFAEVDAEGAHQIIVTGKDTFVALDRKLQVRLEFDGDGDVGGELLMVVPGKSIAGQPAPDRLMRVALR
ncbi:hypothetical protein LJR289_003187 [Pseudoduganella sp. LjRoot289]|uniref:hypothetical protein n=1 Tax=Pseudoduganella sp. LjRoot289 TaxID=3342314 RepID=UPI003ED0039C